MKTIKPGAVRIHLTNDKVVGEPVMVLHASNRSGYYQVGSVARESFFEVHGRCLIRTAQSDRIARKINRKAQQIREAR